MIENKSIPEQPHNEKVSGLPPVKENTEHQPAPTTEETPVDSEQSTAFTGNGNPPPKDKNQ